MSDQDPENQPQGEARPEEGHVSFVQRLHRRFGEAVDPKISLEEEASQRPASGSSPATSKELVQRLVREVQLGPRYHVKDEVARGGMGTIMRVWDEDLRRNLAMKVMHGRSVTEGDSGSSEVDQERLGRFLEEAQITGQLDHPGVVPVHDLGIDSKGRCYFTMRFVRGRELKDVLDLARERKEGWTRTKALGVVLKVCEAMAYAHSKGVVHRDLKPSNVMVGRFGEAYVMDWGLARVLGRRDSHDLRLKTPTDQSSLSLVKTIRRLETEANPSSTLVTMDGDVIGTPSYMSPEQAQGKLEEVGPRSDVYSLGAILYYMLTAQPPYVRPGERVSPHTVLSRVLDGPPAPLDKLAKNEPAELIAICEKAMARDATQRYESMLDVAEDIQAYLENRVVRAYEGGSLAEFRKWVARNRGMAAGIAGMVTLSIASALGFAWQKQGQIESLKEKESETARAKDQAVEAARKAEESASQAKTNLDLAVQKEELARTNELMARANAERALRSGYMANVLAADYSLKLNDVVEARERLRSSDFNLRGWEWAHLNLKANATLQHWNVLGGIDAVAFYPGQQRVITLSGQGKVFVRDLATQKPVDPENIMLAGAVTPATFQSLFSSLDLDVSGDGTRIALVGRDQKVHVFDATTGERIFGDGLEGHAARVTAVAFGLDGRSLASGDENGSIRLWDAQSGESLQRLAGHASAITSLAWSPLSDRLGSASVDGTVRIWDAELGQELQVLRGHTGETFGVAWDLRGETIFSSGEDGSINQWEVKSGRLVRTFAGHQGAVLSIAYDPNEGRLVSGSVDKTVRVWDVETGAAIVLQGHEEAVNDVAFSLGGDLVVSGAKDGTTHVWDSRGDLARTELAFHRWPIQAVAVQPTGEGRIVSCSERTVVNQRLTADDGELILWDSGSGEPLRRLRGHEGPITSVVFDHEGKRILSGSMDRTARLWDAQTGRLLKTFSGHEKWIDAVAITHDGTRVITGSGDRIVRILDAETTEVLHELAGHRGPVSALAISPDGTHLASAGKDVLIWDLGGALGEPDTALNISSSIRSLAYSPDGQRLAVGLSNKHVQIWELSTGAGGDGQAKLLVTQQDHSAEVRAVAFTPDGSRLASASADGTIRIRDGVSGESYLVLEEEGVTSLAFSADGSRLISGASDGRLRVFETKTDEDRRLRSREMEALRRRADELVDDLFAEHFLLEEVLPLLEGDLDLDRPLKECALRRAHLRGDDPELLFARTLREALSGDQPPEVYERALRRAQAAETLDERQSFLEQRERRRAQLWLLALGAANYRMQSYGEALSFLKEAARADPSERTSQPGLRRFGPREETIRMLFLCMAQAQTDQVSEAREVLASARTRVSDDPELVTLLDEAAGLVGTAPGS